MTIYIDKRTFELINWNRQCMLGILGHDRVRKGINIYNGEYDIFSFTTKAILTIKIRNLAEYKNG